MTKKHTIFISFLVIFLTILGVAGYMYFEGWNFSDSLYMTIITLTTTGFQEVHELSQTGRYFTMTLLILGMGVVAYSVSVIMNFILNYDFSKRSKEKMQLKINKLSGHTIICGFGRMGRVICKELNSQNVDFVVIEKSKSGIDKLKETNFLYIEGDAALDDNLQKACIENAKALVCMIDNDSDALYISLAARSLNQKIHIISRAQDEVARKRMYRAGANKVILPIVVSGIKVAESVINPAVEDFLDITGVNLEGENRIQLADMKIRKGSPLINKTLAQEGPNMRDLIIVGVRKPNKKFIFYPNADYTFDENDCLIAMGSRSAYKSAIKKYLLDDKASSY